MTKARSHNFNWSGYRYKMLYEVSFCINYFEHYSTGHLIVVTHINAGDVILCKFNYDYLWHLNIKQDWTNQDSIKELRCK